jgi:hypothetical protein
VISSSDFLAFSRALADSFLGAGVAGMGFETVFSDLVSGFLAAMLAFELTGADFEGFTAALTVLVFLAGTALATTFFVFAAGTTLDFIGFTAFLTSGFLASGFFTETGLEGAFFAGTLAAFLTITFLVTGFLAGLLFAEGFLSFFVVFLTGLFFPVLPDEPLFFFDIL